ncbi:hypothetical protein BDZ89DRAFT_1079696 [Hymenopellis radicata]|nr:hypothetical protein BDZ89DRAFT_1079696 [Hymenopellis radicata]
MDDNEVLFQRIVHCLVRTGEWDRLKAKLNSLLDESGWSRQIQQNGREFVPPAAHTDSYQSDMPATQDLCDRMSTDAHRLLPKDVREEINALLREAIQRNYS